MQGNASSPAGKQVAVLYAEQVRLLFNNAPLAYTTTILNGAILAYILRNHVPTLLLVGWYGCLLLVTALRAMLVWRYHRTTPEPDRTDFWKRLYLIGAMTAGIVWGSTAFLVFPTDSVAHRAFVAFMLAGMSAGGVSVLSSRIEVSLAFLLPTLLPLAWQYLTTDGDLHTAMGVLTLIFLVGMCISALSFHRIIRTSLNLRFDKRELQSEVEQRRKVEEELFQEKEQLQTTLRSIGEAVIIIDAEGLIQYLNPAAERLCGWRTQHALHRHVGEVFQSFDRDHRRNTTAMEDCLRSPGWIKKHNILHCLGNDEYLAEETATALHDRHGKLAGVVGVLRDVTEELQRTELLAHAATHDALTGLPNRNLLKDRTEQAIVRAQRRHERFALLFLDLDRFKTINDNMGHTAGDNLLINVAQRLSECVRDEDTIARLGGDEFVVLLDGATKKKQINKVANKILRAFQKPFLLNTGPATVTASIGVSLYPEDGKDPDTLLDHADTAMYRAKELGRNRACTS